MEKNKALPRKKDIFFLSLAEYKEFLLLERGLSPATIDSYSADLKHFFTYLRKIGCPNLQAIDEETVSLFLLAYKQENPESKATTYARYCSTLRGYGKYLQRTGQIQVNFAADLPAPKLQQPFRYALTYAQIKELLAAPDLSTPLGLRDKAMLELGYSCGLRVSELVSVTLYDFDFDNQILRVMGKGSKERMVPIGNYAIKALKQYLQHGRNALLHGKKTQEVFLNRLGEGLSRSGYWRILSGYGKRLNLSLHPHTLRHSAATHMLDNGADLRIVQEFLGHSSISTTQIYTNFSRSELKSHYLQHHPRGGIE